jgi:hypothetical protein
MRRRLLPTVALLAVLSLVVAACGQKSGVHLATGGDGSGAFTDEGLPVDADGNPIGEGAVDAEGNPIAVDEAGNPVTNGGGAGGSTSSTRRGNTRVGVTTTTTTKAGTVSPTKVWGDTVMIGIHAPITGAAPLPSSFQDAATFVKEHFNKNSPLPPGPNGKPRTIDITIVDDQYQPAVATQRCNEMVKQKNAFLLIGAAGTDQIQACARYAATVGVPYLSAGVTEKGLRSLKNYFAVSMSYKQQGPYLANFMRQEYPDLTTDPKDVWMVYSNTPNFGDAVSAFKAAWPAPGPTIYQLPRTPTPNDLSIAAQKMCSATKPAKVAYPLMAPKDWLILLGALTCTPKWAGVGVTQGVNEVAKNGCRGSLRERFDGSTFFSPFPGINPYEGTGIKTAREMDDEFNKAVGARAYDDIWIALWGTTKGVVELLAKAGKDLSRASFVASTETVTGLGGPPSGMNPVLNFSPADHFGARQVHVLKADCSVSQYETYRAFTAY